MENESKHFGRGGARSGSGRKPGPAKDVAKARTIYCTEGEWTDATNRAKERGLKGASAYFCWLLEEDERRRRTTQPS